MEPYFKQNGITMYLGDCRKVLPALPEKSVNCCVTSPPYFGLRDYKCDDQIGMEETPDQYVATMVAVFREVWRVLRDDGTTFLNLGDTYANDGKWGGATGGKHVAKLHGSSCIGRTKKRTGISPKSLIGIPWRVALALQDDGWILRQDIIWSKTNCLPESVKDRFTKSHEYIFMLTKQPRYYFNHEAIQEPAICGAKGSEFHTGKTGDHQLGRSQKVRPSKPKGSFGGKTEEMAATGQNAFRAVTETRNKRSVWTVSTKPYSGAHFAVFPAELIEPCVRAGCPEGGTVLDPFLGSGTTADVAKRFGCNFVGTELNEDYIKLAIKRVGQQYLW